MRLDGIFAGSIKIYTREEDLHEHVFVELDGTWNGSGIGEALATAALAFLGDTQGQQRHDMALALLVAFGRTFSENKPLAVHSGSSECFIVPPGSEVPS